MQRTENVELTVLCLIHQNDKYLLQNRLKDDWKGLTLPGGHIEKNESIIDAVIQEMKEETGLDIQNPRLCGIKQFPIENGQYIVFLFHTDEFLGEVTSSEEGEMVWVKKSELPKMNTVNDLMYNADFNTAAYEEIMSEAGLNRFIMSVKQWVSRTNQIINYQGI